MKVKYLIVSALAVACLLLIAVSSHSGMFFSKSADALAPASRLDDLTGPQIGMMARAQYALENILMSVKSPSGHVDIAALRDRGIAQSVVDSVFRDRDDYIRFFFGEMPALAGLNDRLIVRCDMREGARTEQFYFVFFLNAKDGGFPVHVYTRSEAEEKYKDLKKLAEQLPERKPEDVQAIARYINNGERAVDQFIRQALESPENVAGLPSTAAAGTAEVAGYIQPGNRWATQYREYLSSVMSGYLSGRMEQAQVKEILNDKRMVFIRVQNGRFPVIREDGREVEVKSHVSDHAFYVFLDDESFDIMNQFVNPKAGALPESALGQASQLFFISYLRQPDTSAVDLTRTARRLVNERILFALAHEMGVTFGLPARFTAEGELENDMSSDFRNRWNFETGDFSAQGRSRIEFSSLLHLKPVELACSLHDRDYASGSVMNEQYAARKQVLASLAKQRSLVPFLGYGLLPMYNQESGTNWTVRQVSENPELQAVILAWAVKTFNLAGIPANMDLTLEHEMILRMHNLKKTGLPEQVQARLDQTGSIVQFSGHVPELALSMAEAGVDWRSLRVPTAADFENNGITRTGYTGRTVANLRSEFKDTKVVIGYIKGPFSLVCDIMGTTRALMATAIVVDDETNADDKELRAEFDFLMDYAEKFVGAYAEYLIAQGADSIAILDPTATGNLSPNFFQTYSLRPVNRLSQRIRSLGALTAYHPCRPMSEAAAQGLLKFLASDRAEKMDVDILSIDAIYNLRAVYDALKQKYGDAMPTLIGNVDTLHMLPRGVPAEVEEAIALLFAQMGDIPFLCGSSCDAHDWGAHNPRETMNAFSAAAEKGRSPFAPSAEDQARAAAEKAVAAEVNEMAGVAGLAGAEVARESMGRYIVLVSDRIIKNDEFERDNQKYKDRFSLGKVGGQAPSGEFRLDLFVTNVLERVTTEEDRRRTVVLVPGDTIGVDLEEQLKRLTDVGIRFVLAGKQWLGADAQMDVARERSLTDMYAVMLLVRSLNDGMARDNAVYRTLSYYIKTHFTIPETLSVDDYIGAIVKNDLAKLIKGYLSYRPIQAYDARKEYEAAAKALISA